jgi:membrane protease subunit (stomatin/prohibitin family)
LEKSPIVPNTVNIADLISELDEMDGTTEHKQAEHKQAENQWFKSCANKDCMYNLPKDAKFCLECGTAQMPKFCTECGFSFPAMEKFCPDCGKKR